MDPSGKEVIRLMFAAQTLINFVKRLFINKIHYNLNQSEKRTTEILPKIVPVFLIRRMKVWKSIHFFILTVTSRQLVFDSFQNNIFLMYRRTNSLISALTSYLILTFKIKQIQSRRAYLLVKIKIKFAKSKDILICTVYF